MLTFSASARAQSPSELEVQLDTLSDQVRLDPGNVEVRIERLKPQLNMIDDAATREYLLGIAERVEGTALVSLNRNSEAEPLLLSARSRLQRLSADDDQTGQALLALAVLRYRQSKMEEALPLALRAHDILRDAGDERAQANALLLIGGLYRDARDYERTLRYYRDADEAFSGDPMMRLAAANNRALVLRETKQTEEAITEFRQALSIAQGLGNELLQSRILTNIAATYAEAGDLEAAKREALRADALTNRPENAGWRPFVIGTEAQILAKEGRYKEAAAALDAVFRDRDIANTEAAFRDFHAIASEVYSQTGRPRDAFIHLQALKRLDDLAAQISASANNAILAAQFDFAGQEVRIANLRNQQLESQVERERERAIVSRNTAFGVVLGAAIIITLTLIALYNVRRRREEVSRVNETLKETNADLTKALNAKSEFLATTSHEIRTPLNGVLGMTQIMLADRKLDPMVRERVELVHGAGNTMKAIVDDILDVAKMETGTVALRSERFNLRSALSEVARIFEDTARSKGLDWHVDLNDCPEKAIGDEQRVRQVVLNLISNGVKFTNEGHIRLHAAPSGDDPDVLHICVSDTGIGIPEDQQASVFSPFHQVDSTRTRAFSGTGLGLTICRELVNAMSGELNLQSQEGEGSRFDLLLPLSLQEANPSGAKEASAPGTDPQQRAVLYAPNALVEMIATRALGTQADRLTVEQDFDTALNTAKETSTLLLAFGTTGTLEQIAALQRWHADYPNIAIAAAGWPKDAATTPEEVCRAYVTEVPAMAKLVEKLKAPGFSAEPIAELSTPVNSN
jgi:signal transduction histidine kinase|tara:strand:- start:106688 stop:109099 length:2412 start_codon:yes stop_codon:yes gene_type:complete